jgi:MFS transporter, PAT family, beta-lactamase induction signal transducer AmpG
MRQLKIKDHYLNKSKKLAPLFFVLYFFEGAPIGLIWWAIPTIMASNGVGVDTITSLVSLAALPWTFKFLLAPVVDRWFESVRSYALGVASFQFLMLICLGLMLLTPINDNLFFWLTLGVSLFSAIQDVFIDGWAIGMVDDESRGKVNGAMQSGMLTGRWVFGAGLLMALASIEWKWAVGFLCLTTSMSIIFLLFKFIKRKDIVSEKIQSFSLNSFQFIFTKNFLTLAVIAAFTGFAFESLGSTVGPFLIGNGLLQFDVGLIMSGTLLAMLTGALVGGKLTDQHGDQQVFFKAGLGLAF